MPRVHRASSGHWPMGQVLAYGMLVRDADGLTELPNQAGHHIRRGQGSGPVLQDRVNVHPAGRDPAVRRCCATSGRCMHMLELVMRRDVCLDMASAALARAIMSCFGWWRARASGRPTWPTACLGHVRGARGSWPCDKMGEILICGSRSTCQVASCPSHTKRASCTLLARLRRCLQLTRSAPQVEPGTDNVVRWAGKV
jgi:hypothetical protein